MDQQPFVYIVPVWLVLGPVPDGLPLFHDEKRGGYGAAELLKSTRGPSPRSWPADGVAVTWPGGGTATWIPAAEPYDGLAILPALPTRGGRASAAAWLASYVSVDRFAAFAVEVTGAHPRRLWVDGEPVAAGGVSKDDGVSEVKGAVTLEQGTHLFMLETILDPDLGERWAAGATLTIATPGPDGGPTVASSVEPRRDLALADVLDAPQIVSVALSPDGALVAEGLSRIVPGSDDAATWVEVRSTADGALVRTLREGGIGMAAWSPVGRKLAYLARDLRDGTGEPHEPRAKDAESSTLWLADLETGETVPIIERVEKLSGYRWAPDGASIAYEVTSKLEPDKRGVKLREALLDRQAGWRDKSFLYQVAVPGGVTRRLTAGALTTHARSFSADAGRLLVSREVEDLSERPFSRTEVWELDLATLAGTKLHESRWLVDAQYAADGRRLLIVSGPSEFGDLGRTVPDGTTPNEMDGQLYLFDPSSGRAEALSREFAPSIEGLAVGGPGGTIYVTAADADRTSLYRYDDASTRFVRLDVGSETLHELSVAHGADAIVCSAGGPWSPPALWSVDVRGGAARRLDAPAEAWLGRVRTGAVAPIAHRSQSGRTVDGRVYLPPGFDASAKAKYPAIVHYYGGTTTIAQEFGGRYPCEWWAAKGYVVYVVQPTGATGYGQERSAIHVNDWGQVTSEEILDGTQAFLAAYPAVDVARVGCIGASYGGFMTMLLVTRTDMFAAAVAHAGISNIASYWGEGNWGYSYSALASAGSYPWNRKDVYVDRSPLFHADKVKTPVLLTHGAADANVPVGESETFYTALKLVGAPVELLTVDGQDHWILDHAKRSVWSRSIVAWFDRWLKGQPAWWDDLYPTTPAEKPAER
jgi:dipeptidyl aminopeptidase/acylaminoacyl peptidase